MIMLIFLMGALLGVPGGCTGTVKVPPPAPKLRQTHATAFT